MRGSWLNRFAREESGAAGVEYGLLIAAISAAIVVVAFAIGVQVENAFDYTSSQIDSQL
jgi:Flp pilus assembly pilin Flp